MTVIDTVMGFYDMMNDDEKRELILRIGEKALADGLVKEADVAKATGKASGKKRGRGKGFWMKSVRSIDDSKKGVFAVEGDWVNDVKRDLADKEMCIIGTNKDGVKEYTLVQRMDGHSVECGGRTVADVVCIQITNKFSELLPEMKKRLA